MVDSPPPPDAALLRNLVDHLSAMVAYWDASQRCRFANRAYQRWFGVSPDALIGTHIRDLLGPLYELNLPYIEGALRGERQTFERAVPDPEGGSPRHSLAEYVPDVVGGVVRGFFVLVTDVSAIKRAEAMFAGIVDLSPDAIVSIDRDQRIRLFNDGAREIFGWTPEEVLGQPLDVLIPPRFREVHRAHVRAFAEGERKTRRLSDHRPPLFGLRKNGEEFPAEASLSKLGAGPDLRLTVSMRDIGERVRLESERRVLAALIENSSDFIGVADAAGKPIYVNPAGRRMVGLAPDFPVEQTQIPDYYAPDERSFATDVIVPSMVERGRWSGETRFRNWQTGAAIPVSDEHFMIRDPDGRVLGMGTVTRDISEAQRIAREREELLVREHDARARAEAATAQLAELEERFRLAIDDAPIGMAIVALDGRFVRVNRALCEIVGYAADELTGLTFQAITHPDDLDADLELAGKLARGEIPRYQLAKRYLRKDGAIVDIMLSGSALRGADGAPRYFIAQIEDITDRKRLEDEQSFLAEAGLVFAGSLDLDATLSRIAELAVREFADLCSVDVVEQEETVRRVKVTSRDPARASLCRAIMEVPLDRSRSHVMYEGLTARRSLLLARPSPSEIDALAQSDAHLGLLRAADIRSLIVVPLIARDSVVGAIAFISSTPGRYGPAELRFAEGIASRAALSIENARLYEAARRATQARDDVLAVVAHDLRNPLNSIVLHAEVLARAGRRGAPPDAEAAPAIARAAHRMNHLIQDLLDVASLEAGHLAVSPVRVSPAELAGRIVDTQRLLATAAGLELASDAPATLPDLEVDPDRMLQVFENLIGNAMKFTKPGGRITVGARADPGEVVFSVRDTGPGIPASDVPHVFDRFWQARKRARHGAGLGLPIAKGIVEAHHGRIWVESELGVGTTFFFAIPVPARPADAARAAS